MMYVGSTILALVVVAALAVFVSAGLPINLVIQPSVGVGTGTE